MIWSYFEPRQVPRLTLGVGWGPWLLWTLCSCSMHGSVKTTHQSISPRLSSTLWLLSSWSLMKSGQSSSTSCPMFRMAEMTWLQGLSKWAIREDLKYKAKGETIGWITCWGIFWSHTLRLAEAAPRSNPANQQVSCLRGGKATSAIGPNVLKIFSFTESCNSCHASFSLYWSCCHSQINSHVQWFASVEHSPTSSLCRHSLRLPGVKYTWEFVPHIYSYHIYYRTYLYFTWVFTVPGSTNSSVIFPTANAWAPKRSHSSHVWCLANLVPPSLSPPRCPKIMPQGSYPSWNPPID